MTAASLWHNRWALLPVAMLVATAGLLFATVWLAISGHDAGAEPAYDTKAESFQQELSQRARNEQLRWIVTPQIERGDADLVLVRLNIEDKHAKPIEAQRVSIECIPLLSPKDRQSVDLPRVGEGAYAAGVQIHAEGLWEFRVRVHAGEDAYTDRFRRRVPAREVSP